MKKYIFFILILLVVCCIILYNLSKPRFKIVEYTLEGKTYRLYLADTPKKWKYGLMYKKKLKDTDGMLFVFPTKEERVFYNKNTYLDLNIYWINDSSVVGKGYLPSIEKSKIVVYLPSKVKVDKVVELVVK